MWISPLEGGNVFLDLPESSSVLIRGRRILAKPFFVEGSNETWRREDNFKLFDISKQIFFLNKLYYLKKVSFHNTVYKFFIFGY